MPSVVNNLMDNLFERKYRQVGQEKNTLGFFSCWVFCFNIVPAEKGSKYREFYNLSGPITCMTATAATLIVATAAPLTSAT